MIDKPNIQDAALIDCLRKNYGLPIKQITFLPLGSDRNTVVYRADAEGGAAYFVKLRREDFNEMSLVVPKFLSSQGVPHIIAPLASLDGKVWVQVSGYYLSVYPFILGRNGHDVGLADTHWVELGRTLRGLHSTALPPEMLARVPKENFSGEWRERVRQFQKKIDETTFVDPVASALADLLRRRRTVVDSLVRRAERLGAVLKDNLPPLLLCHADIHAWNMLIQADGTFYVVDWDTIILAPKERDLMFIASGLFGKMRTPEQEEALFYQGYDDQRQVDPVGLAYYRCERIVRDIAEYCEDIFLTEPGGESKAENLRQLSLQFEPGQVVDMALRSEQYLAPELRSF